MASPLVGMEKFPVCPSDCFGRKPCQFETVRTREASREEIAQLVEELWRDRARTGIVEQIERRLAG